MDWKSITFDWNRARAFLVTAEEGSLAAAARALDMTQPTLGRQVTALEQELGVALFERHGRGLTLTPSGMELVEHVRTMGEAANRLSLTASGQSNNIEGNICITASEITAALILPPIIQKLRQIQPGIHIELIASNSETDLRRREADIAIRNFRPTQPDFYAKKIYDIKAHLYAAKSYIKQLKNPASPDDLSKATFIGFDNSGRLLTMLNERGFKLTNNNFPVESDSSIVQWEFVKQGLAIGIMSEEVGDAEPLVERLLPSFEPFTAETWLVTHRELKTNRRIRLVFDFLASEAEERHRNNQ